MPQNAVKGKKMKRLLFSLLLISAVSGIAYATASVANPAPVPGSWYRSGPVTLGAGLYLVHISTGLTAHAGGSQQTTETPALTEVNEVTTSASSNDSLTMSCKAAGQTRFIENAAATNAIKVYALTPGTVNGIATATGYSVAAGKSALCIATALTATANACNWACVGP